MTPAGSPAIVVRGLRKSYGGRVVVDGIDLEVASGAIAALLGPNGAGKTTTVEIVEGYRHPDAGQVRVLGLDPIHDGRALRARVGLMLQDGGIYPQARPAEILRLYARFYRDPIDPETLLERSGLGEVAGTRYRVLSGGQRQRLGLALALIGRPELVVLDEPTAGMDPAAKAATRELIVSLRDAGVTILVTTHELIDVERLADRIAIIDHGRIVAEGTPAELAAGAEPSLRVRLDRPLGPADRASLETALRASKPGPAPVGLLDDGGPGRYRLSGSGPDPAVVAAVAAWCASAGVLIVELRTAGATLEERYLELTARSAGDAA
jgi:ABC-2 type transport system ATP-binding protein